MSPNRGIGAALVVSLLLASPLAVAKKKKAPKADFQAEAPPSGDQPSKALERALKLYDGEDYYSASIELNKVVEGESGDTEPNQQKAEFWMGKSLYNLRFYSAALSYFDRIVQKGPSHAYYNATLKWLASLSRQLPDSTGILEKIGKYNRTELDQPALEKVRDELYFLLGKFYYQKGQFKEAVELFNTVPTSSEFYVQAKLFEGATHVREYQAKPAVESFKEVLRAAAESDDPKVRPFEDLANLSLARTFYSTGQFELATKYFDRVSQDSDQWPDSLFESSWANFMLKQKGYSKALGNIHTLQAPFFENYIKPESVGEALTVKATIYFYNCLYDRAEGAIYEFNSSYPQMFQELSKLVSSTTDNAAMFETAVKIRKGTSGLPEHTERSARARPLGPQLGQALRVRRRADARAEPARKGGLVVEEHEHRPEHPGRPHLAEVAGDQRGGRSVSSPHQAAHRRAGAADQARHQDRVRNPPGNQGRDRGRGRQPCRRPRTRRRTVARRRFASTTSTSCGRSVASTGATSSATTA